MSLFADLFKDKRHEQFFKCLCQNEDCKALVGGMHIPCSAGAVIFVCQKCGTVSEFVNGLTRWETKVIGKIRLRIGETEPDGARASRRPF